MHVYPTLRTLAAIPLVLLSLAAHSNATTKNDSTLWNKVPMCARACTLNWVMKNYGASSCGDVTDVKCLCTHKTPSGLTLGEAALSCIYALCHESLVISANAYHVCDSVPGAISATHSSLLVTTWTGPYKSTATQTTTTTHTRTDTTTSSDSSSRTTSTDSALTTSTKTGASSEVTVFQPTPSESGSMPTIVSTKPPSATSAPDSSTSSASKKKHSKNVSPGTVIGVSVVSGVAGSFIIGVGVFFYCKRWKRNNRVDDSDSSDSFEIGGTMAEPPGFSEPSSERSTPSPRAGSPVSGAEFKYREMSQRTYNFPTTKPLPIKFHPHADPEKSERPPEQKQGFAANTESERDSLPQTLSSQSTLTESLSGRNTGLYPKPLKWGHRPASVETLFEEDEPQHNSIAHNAIDQRPKPTQRSGSPSVMTGLPSNPRALKEGFPAEKFLRQGRGTPPPNPGTTSTPPTLSKAQRRISFASDTSTTARESPNTPTNPSSTSKTLPRTPSNADSTPNNSSIPKPTPSPPTPTPTRPLVPGPLDPSTEIVSRPRIVRGDDIKRVQIRSGPRPPSEVLVPYCPEDFWLERGRVLAPHPQATDMTDLPYPSETCPGSVLYPSSPKKRPEDVARRVSLTSRNLTPSRRGEDLILRVE